jgi:HD superfamily phosphohydrolase
MANNQFVAFPAFASTTRYEHSLGVCFLAGICASHLNLSESQKMELMLACLYHDVGTPPFAHAMEEVLQREFGFDHEANLRQLLIGNTGEFDYESAQIYDGKMLRLNSVCQRAKKKGIAIDLDRIARIATGDPSEPLSLLVCGEGMDLDNIDNIIRASTAMGIIDINYSTTAEKLAHSLARSFVLKDNKVYYDSNKFFEISEWQRIRDVQYTAIFDSIDDFSYQTMIKHAIGLLIDFREDGCMMSKTAWRMTDSTFTCAYLLKHSKSRAIMQRVQRCEPFNCLGVLYVSGENVSRYINEHLPEIEAMVSEYLISHLNYSKDKQERTLKALITKNVVVANFYPDKRKRSLSKFFLNYQGSSDGFYDTDQKSGALLGLFTPLKTSGYRTENVDGQKKRLSNSFSKADLESIIRILSDNCLSGFSIEEYGSGLHGQSNQAKTEFDQLGFFGLQ